MARQRALVEPFVVFWIALKGWSKDNVPRLGASLAYYTLFAIAPVLLIAIAIAGMVFGPEAVRGEVVTEIESLIGAEGARAVQAALRGIRERGGGGLAVVVGTATFLIAATGAFGELQHALNTVFRVKASRRSGVMRLLIKRLKSLGMVVSLGFLLLVSLAVSAALSAVSSWVGRQAGPIVPVGLQLVNLVGSLGVITLLFAMVYRVLPDARLEWRDVLTGALVTALLFTVGKHLIGLYLGRSSVASAYGAAGSIVVLLLWVYYTSQIVLLGAEVTRVTAERRRGRAPEPDEFGEPNPAAHPSAP
jgi:membrane protein